MKAREVRYWIGVVSRDRVLEGAREGFCQLWHGKEAPLRRMQQGDYIIYYSHKLSFGSSEPCQKFTAVGQVLGEEIFTYEPEPGSVFYRRRARYFPSTEASVRPLIEKLEFIRNKKQWGAPFRYGLLQISKQDFEIIAAAMGVDLTALQTSNLNL